jgi:hypothetical protein
MERDHWIEIFKINRCANRPIPPSLCQRAEYGVQGPEGSRDAYSKTLFRQRTIAIDGGADRDRTDDLKLAKLALSQLSYGPRDNNISDRRSNGGPGTS